jgi:hypothetical protein
MPASWNRNRLTAKVGIDYPIIQGPLGGLSSQRLTAAGWLRKAYSSVQRSGAYRSVHEDAEMSTTFAKHWPVRGGQGGKILWAKESHYWQFACWCP